MGRFALVAVAALSGCATANPTPSPPPSALANAQWWDGAEFVSGTRWVRDDVFVAEPQSVSETVDLGASYVMPAAGNRCGLAPPCRADAILYASDPRLGSARVIMQLAGGRPAGGQHRD